MIKRKICGKPVGICTILLVIIIVSPLPSNNEVSNNEHSQFLINTLKIPNYELRLFDGKPYDISMRITSDSTTIEAYCQEWYHSGGGKGKVRYVFSVFDSEVEAHNGIFFGLHISTRPNYSWGSFDGSIIGDKCWTNGRSIAFIKGNIGVNIGVTVAPFLPDDSNRVAIDRIVKEIYTKVENNLSKEIIERTERLRKTQISKEQYFSLLAALRENVLHEFTLLQHADSKWSVGNEKFELEDIMKYTDKVLSPSGKIVYSPLLLPPAKQILLGRRSEWQNEQGILIGIDIGMFPSHELATDAIKRRAAESNAFFIDNPLDPQILEERWWFYSTCASVVFMKDKAVIHIYQFNQQNKRAEADLDFFANAAKKIAEAISNIE